MNRVKLTIIFLGLCFNGCSQVLKSKEVIYVKDKPFSCEERVEPKSLEFLEQQYRCNIK